MLKLKREVRPMEVLPRFYGLGYLDPCLDVAICYPIPINFVVRGCTNAYRYIRHAAQPNRFERELSLSYHRGWVEANAEVDIKISVAVKNAEADVTQKLMRNLMREIRRCSN